MSAAALKGQDLHGLFQSERDMFTMERRMPCLQGSIKINLIRALPRFGEHFGGGGGKARQEKREPPENPHLFFAAQSSKAEQGAYIPDSSLLQKGFA